MILKASGANKSSVRSRSYKSRTKLVLQCWYLIIRKDWRLKKRQLLCLVILQQFLAIYCQLLIPTSQNLGFNSHFEGLKVSRSQLDQNL